MKYHLNLSVLFAAAVFLVGCSAVNNYRDFYTSYQRNQGKCEILQVEHPHVEELLSLDEVDDWRARGYEVIGSSSFYGFWSPRAKALEVAREQGASVVLLYGVLEHEQERTETVYVPETVNTQHTWTGRDRHGRRRNYSETTTSTVYVPTTVSRIERFYTQKAYYLARRKLVNSYGIYFVEPDHIPGGGSEAVPVIVDVVIKGSPAESAGICPGDVVESINGNAVANFQEAEAYMNGTKPISKVEVRHE